MSVGSEKYGNANTCTGGESGYKGAKGNASTDIELSKYYRSTAVGNKTDERSDKRLKTTVFKHYFGYVFFTYKFNSCSHSDIYDKYENYYVQAVVEGRLEYALMFTVAVLVLAKFVDVSLFVVMLLSFVGEIYQHTGGKSNDDFKCQHFP